MTVYWVDPSTICSSLPEKQLGDRLILKNGNSENYISMPLNQADTAGTNWIEGKCFVSMGKHYWYNITKTMDCDYFYPLFLIYNDGLLDVWGVDIDKYETSTRWEHPTPETTFLFFNEDTKPDCMSDESRQLSTLHVYMNNPYWSFC